MSHRYDPRERLRWDEETQRRDDEELVEREAFARDAGDPRWGTGGLAVEERPYRDDRVPRPPRQDVLERPWPRGPGPRESPFRAQPPGSGWESAHGPYVGVGPRGYRRSDERIREDVCERFAEHGQLDPSDVEVAVRGGEVLLTGSVATRTQKRLAEDIADRVFGVVEVQNHLHVQRAGEAAQMPRGAPATADVGRAHPSSAAHR
jgi:BON domain